MCHKTTCNNCGKATWSGCGQHIEQALSGVADQDRCTCDQPAPKGLLSRIFGR